MVEESKLNITIDKSVPPEVASECVGWINDIVEWLLAQPVPADLSGSQPRYSEIAYTVADTARSYGLRNRSTGKGYLNLDIGSDLKIEVRGSSPSFTVIPTTTEIACKGNWAFVISQLNFPAGYYKSGFAWEACLGYQLKYLDRLAENNRQLRSLLDDYQQSQADKIEQERLDRLGKQQQEKWHQKCQQQRYDVALRVPNWYVDIYKDAPQLQRDYLITSNGHVVAKHENGVTENA